ncbi:class II lanthipeptide, LchA2/BrtA2 family [Oceanobacillus kimchii]|uniref:class II lanthipeptide, LchA2/BrtA2 family n=1 Tax=Oceanobacillus TaxID=182709 RepID=UPI00034C9D6D|nr:MULTISPECIES: class II lanthipeptide, LchA2/BrtA2 family [Oceanobacillus]MBT2599803.1 class II lanthipeptide, LchA2/BrtA2 family [Oceanobacillus sp. ISL-74]MCT1576984.1 class II lanthipeptide, LchA2/BrtA2 family [Oceanobacillus kimchii]MCT2135054.1 class II lanthipeptide, LchA2/BrtA2 family [Oceanobacillus kimchii]
MDIIKNSSKRIEINTSFENHPAGEISEEELLAISGGQVEQNSLSPLTPSSGSCVAISLAFCPTSACTSDCTEW